MTPRETAAQLPIREFLKLCDFLDATYGGTQRRQIKFEVLSVERFDDEVQVNAKLDGWPEGTLIRLKKAA